MKGDHATKEHWFTCANHTETAKQKLSNVTTTSAVTEMLKKKKKNVDTKLMWKVLYSHYARLKPNVCIIGFKSMKRCVRNASQNWSTHIQYYVLTDIK